ncbi:hypothetical protein LINPERHAP1_LOCUS20740, partial [Linum perenne]
APSRNSLPLLSIFVGRSPSRLTVILLSSFKSFSSVLLHCRFPLFFFLIHRHYYLYPSLSLQERFLTLGSSQVQANHSLHPLRSSQEGSIKCKLYKG